MTNKKAKRILIEDTESLKANPLVTVDECLYQALDTAIKALEQTDVLDKIRAEIEEYKSRQLTLAIGIDDLEKGKQIALEYVLAILDKYREGDNDAEH